jgi:D-tyrosyl-tRNA(Tyr) deacylase
VSKLFISHSSKDDDFVRALQQAKNVYEEFAEALRRLGVTVATGVFGAMMSVELVNEGPVTILLDSDKTF